MAGTLVLTTLSDGTNSTSATNAIQGSAKAWVNFNGVSGASIRASYNVSSVTRAGTGNYTVNFTNAFTDTNYSAVGIAASNTTLAQIYDGGLTKTTSAYQINTMFANNTSGGGGVVDSINVQIAFFR